jgi:riboflavin biosynthesis pyrimidine reductase
VPAELERLYGGPIGFEAPRVVANFVETLDGVVAIPGLARSNAVIAGGSDADRFVMALLRACADVVLLGSGTLRSAPAGTWRPDRAYPPVAEELAALRAARGLPELPAVAIVTAGSSFDPAHPVLERGALVLTTAHAATRLRTAVPSATEVVPVGERTVDLRAAVHALRERGHQVVLSEGGPTLLASLLAARLVDELFLTLSPLLAGRASAPRLSLVEGLELLPDTQLATSLCSARRSGSHIFLRYSLR